jgi:hypothetical protein
VKEEVERDGRGSEAEGGGAAGVAGGKREWRRKEGGPLAPLVGLGPCGVLGLGEFGGRCWQAGAH